MPCAALGERRRRTPDADRRERPERPAGDARPRAVGGLGLGQRLVRRLPPRAARCADRRARRLLRRLRDARRPREGAAAGLRLRRALLRVPPASPGRAAGRARRAALRRVRAEPRPGRQPRARRPPLADRRSRAPEAGRRRSCCSRRSCRCCSWARSTARRRRSCTSPITATSSSTSPCARAGHASSPPSRGRGELLDPHDPEAFARSQLDWTLREHGHHRAAARPLSRAARAATRSRAAGAAVARRRVGDRPRRCGDAACCAAARAHEEVLVAFHLGDGREPADRAARRHVGAAARLRERALRRAWRRVASKSPERREAGTMLVRGLPREGAS